MKLVGSKDSITFTVSMPDGYIAAVSGESQVERQKGNAASTKSPNISGTENGGILYLLFGDFGGGKTPLHKPYPYSLYIGRLTWPMAKL